MKKFFKGGFFLLFVVVVVGVLFATFRVKPTKSQKMDRLIQDISLEKMVKDVADQVAIHKKYIYLLQGLKSQIQAVGSALESKANVARGFGEIGDEYLKSKILPLALQNYKLGLEIFPQDPILNYKLGVVLANLGTYEGKNREQYLREAQNQYQKSLALNPSYNDPQYSLALLYLVAHENSLAIGTISQAMSEIQRYLEKNSANLQAYFLKARIAYAQGDNKTALQTYQTILNLAPVGSSTYKQAQNNIVQLGIG